MTECEEIAETMYKDLANNPANPLRFMKSSDDALQFVKEQMPDESVTVIDNVVEGLWNCHRAMLVALKK